MKMKHSNKLRGKFISKRDFKSTISTISNNSNNLLIGNNFFNVPKEHEHFYKSKHFINIPKVRSIGKNKIKKINNFHNPFVLAFFIGSLLGDCFARKRHKNGGVIFRFIQCKAHKDYIF